MRDNDDDDDDGPRLGFWQHMIAGSVTGIVEHSAMFPIDTIKTRAQMASSASNSCSCASLRALWRAVSSILRAEGAAGLYRGLGAVVAGAGPSHAISFACYELLKERWRGEGLGQHVAADMAAGACATIAGDAVHTPMDVVKQRLQLGGGAYGGAYDCVRRVYGGGGLGAFYASYRTTVLMGLPFAAVQFATYEGAKGALARRCTDEVATHIAAGAAAGALASGVTTPFDVVKTRLQCQGVCGAATYGTGSVTGVVRHVVASEGWRALFKGLVPRVLFHTPATAISWATYEAGKATLLKWNTGRES